jgi:hypothetical protein
MLKNRVEFMECDSFFIVKKVISFIVILPIDVIVTPFIEETHDFVQIDRSFPEVMTNSSRDVSTERSIYMARFYHLLSIGSVG